MSEREELMNVPEGWSYQRTPADGPITGYLCTPEQLAARDARIRADIAAEVLSAKVAAWDEGWRVGASGRNMLNPYRTLSTAKADE